MNNIKNLEWLTGQWEGIISNGIYHEEWNKISDAELSGKAYIIRKGEISGNELLKIHFINDKLNYTADVSHNPAPVSFILTSADDNVFIFENPHHDFPQKITYTKMSDSNLIAAVETTKDGKTRKIVYDLKKI